MKVLIDVLTVERHKCSVDSEDLQELIDDAYAEGYLENNELNANNIELLLDKEVTIDGLTEYFGIVVYNNSENHILDKRVRVKFGEQPRINPATSYDFQLNRFEI